MTNIRKGCQLLLCLVFSMYFTTPTCLGTEYVSFIEKVVRLNNKDVVVDIEVLAEPNSIVSLMVLNEDARTNLIIDEQSALENILYLDQKATDHEGVTTFTFSGKEQLGLSKVRARGKLRDISVAALGNEIGAKDSREMFAIAWSYGDRYYYDKNLITSATLSIKQLEDYGPDVVARAIKERLKNTKDGRKSIFLSPDMETRMFSMARDTVWLDDGALYVQNHLKEFFSSYYEIGGDADIIFSDFEGGLSNWVFDSLPQAEKEEKLKAITENPLYQSQLRPLLKERGYLFCTDLDKSELYDVAYWNNQTNRDTGNYLIWNTVSNEWLRNYWRMAVVDAYKEKFPNAKFSNYGYFSIDGWDLRYRYPSGTQAGHAAYKGGSQTKVGSHSSPVLYGGGYQNPADLSYDYDYQAPHQINPQTFVNSHFRTITTMMNLLRNIFKADDSIAIQPWIHSYNMEETLKRSPYYHEMVFHTALYNPDPLLFFGPQYSAGNDSADVASNIEVMIEILDEINRVVGEGFRKPIKTRELFYGQDYLISGMETETRNLWRYTPNLFDAEGNPIDTDEVDIINQDGKLSITYRQQIVTFPEGSILPSDTPNDKIGYWIETPKGIMPTEEVTLAARTDGDFGAVISFYNGSSGIINKEFSSKDNYCAVLRFDNKKDTSQEINLIVAMYENGKLLSISHANEVIPSGASGQRELAIEQISESTDSIYVFLWDNLGISKPLTGHLQISNQGSVK